MKAITDIFVRHPVLALVVNLLLILVGVRVTTTLPVQQYPKLDSASVLITTVYTGASAETVRGFLTTPIERSVSAIGGVDHIAPWAACFPTSLRKRAASKVGSGFWARCCSLKGLHWSSSPACRCWALRSSP
jgi:hypothetical protein